jgi:hypothetical protein
VRFMLAKTIRRPSVDTAGSTSSPAPVVNGSGLPPAVGIRQRVRLLARAELTTMDFPSGVHAGAPPSATSNESRRGSPPTAETTQCHHAVPSPRERARSVCHPGKRSATRRRSRRDTRA